jgi:hypothetical protein
MNQLQLISMDYRRPNRLRRFADEVNAEVVAIVKQIKGTEDGSGTWVRV